MTIASEAQDILTQAYRLHDRDVWLLSGRDYAEKLAACRGIASAARTLQRNAEKRCNGIMRYDNKARMVLASWTDDDEARAERSDAKAEKAVLECVATIWGDYWREFIDVEFQGDPRGAMVKLWDAGQRDKTSPRICA